MIRRPPGSTRTDTLFPSTTLFRSLREPSALDVQVLILGGDARVAELHAEAPAIVRKLLQNDFISHIYFAKKFALFIGIGRPLRKSWKFRTVCPPVTSLMPSVRAFLASTANRRPTNRSEERRDGKECVSTGRLRGSPLP